MPLYVLRILSQDVVWTTGWYERSSSLLYREDAFFLFLSPHNYSMLDLPSIPRSCPTELFLHRHVKFPSLGKSGSSRCGRWLGHMYFVSDLASFYTDHVSYSLPTDCKYFLCVLCFNTHSTWCWLYLTCCSPTVHTCIVSTLPWSNSDRIGRFPPYSSYILWCSFSLILTDSDALLICSP